MGSEHYCLRWNNHQSNLLGVFSQLLQDESLVDVTLACSEGASIRAHKVVLSACSSYFQTLFLDHPARHPIVILKDVRFSELRTLVEFMYKGEVNVQYCQLSALLKTAESLKVKGLAEMTNQNTALRETEREPERLRPHSATKFETLETTSINKRLEPERCSPSPTRLQNSPTPLALYQRKNNRDHHHLPPAETHTTIHNDDTHNFTKDERSSSPDDDGMSMHSNDVGINMTLNSHTIPSSAPPSIVVPPLSSSSSHHTDIRPSSRSGGLGQSSCIINSCSSNILQPCGSGLPSPMSEPIAGPSGMGPVQQVPLSLKKEIDWDRHEEKLLIGESSSDFRHPHDSMDDQIITGGYRNSSIIGGPVNRCPVPFAFPFAPLGLGLFDADPSRILNLLHHQTLLAEEALRYRGVFVTPKESVRVNPIAEMLSKEQERLFKRNSHLRDNFRYPFTLPDLFPAQKNIQNDELNLNLKRNNTEVHDLYPADENIKNRSETVLKEGSLKFNSDFCINKAASKEMLDEILSKRSGSFLKEGLRFNPLSTNDVQYHQINNKEKSSNSSLTSSSPSIKPIPESLLMQDLSTIEEETKCTVCMATFPSVWLLEQHAALQHSNPMEEKPFICDQYRSAYVKHREQNHRARLPADKLFTCDVCGMQFRYLKSFKKHRLNHALERIHGKHEKKSTDELVSSSNEALIPNEDNVDLKGMIKEEDEDEEQDDTIDSASREDQHMADESQAKITSSEMEISNHNLVIPKPIPESTISTASLTGLLRPDATIGLNPQEASLLNFLRADAVDKQRERRFACPFCGKCVRSKENLKLHVRKHTGERPFVCLFCGRAFGGKSDLTRHLRIHTGERPYHCEACGKCFARADYLSKHLTTHLHNTSR